MFGLDDAAGAFILGSIISGVTSAIGSVFSSAKNYSSTQKTNEMNEALMRESWARDDASRQRMVQDLEGAGLSKWLATGASPMSSSPISLSSPQISDLGSVGDAMSHAFSNASQMKHTEKQNDILDKQGEVLQANEEVLKTENAIKKAELIKANHDAEVFASRPGVASTDPAPLKYVGEGVKFLNGKGGLYDSTPSLLNPVKHAKNLWNMAKSGKDWIVDKVTNNKKESSKSSTASTQNSKKEKPLNYHMWLKKNGLKASEASSRAYDSYFANFY